MSISKEQGTSLKVKDLKSFMIGLFENKNNQAIKAKKTSLQSHIFSCPFLEPALVIPLFFHVCTLLHWLGLVYSEKKLTNSFIFWGIPSIVEELLLLGLRISYGFTPWLYILSAFPSCLDFLGLLVIMLDFNYHKSITIFIS